MEAEILEAKKINHSLEDVNNKLLDKLYELIENADNDDILHITEAVAKLNSSWKSNDQFSKPTSEEEQIALSQDATFGEILGQ